jgi:hypothetical protein
VVGEVFSMNIFDLIFLFSVFVILFGVIALLIAFFTHRRTLARRLGIGLVSYAGLYAILLVGFSLFSPQRVMEMHQVRCYDDWCAAVEQVTQAPAIGSVQAHGSFYLVTVKVTSQAKRISQRALDAAIYLLDGSGVRYDPSSEGQLALQAAGQAGQPLNSLVDAGGSFTYTAAFDLPPSASQVGLVMSHGAFPGNIIIGDDESFLHKPTIVRLSEP